MEDTLGAYNDVKSRVVSSNLVRALNYWDTCRVGSAIPYRDDFDLIEIPELLSTTFFLDIVSEKKFVYRFAGALIEEFFNVGIAAGRTPEELFGENANAIVPPYQHIRETGELLHRQADLSWHSSEKSYIHYEALLLPLSDDDGRVIRVVGIHDYTSDDIK